MKKTMWIISVCTFMITVFVIQFMPDVVPMHYNVTGEIDRWGSKYENLIFPGLIFLMALFWHMFIKFFDKKAMNASDEKERVEAETNGKVLRITALITIAMFSVMQGFMLYGGYVEAISNATHASIDIGKISCILLGCVFVIMGNYMPKAKKNAMLGVRTVWSMHNDITWMKSNRFGAVIFIISGVITIVLCFFTSGNVATVIMIANIIAASIIITLYSYSIYKKETSQNKKI